MFLQLSSCLYQWPILPSNNLLFSPSFTHQHLHSYNLIYCLPRSLGTHKLTFIRSRANTNTPLASPFNYPDLHAYIDLQINTRQPAICLTITPSGPRMLSAPIRPVTWILAPLTGVSTATDHLLLPTLSSSFSSVSLVLFTHILASDGRAGVS